MSRIDVRVRLHVLVGAAVAVVLLAIALPAGANPAGTGLVISQVYGGGGNANATYTHDYIEIFNPTAFSVPVDNWSVQYTSAPGTGNFGGATNLITPLTGSIGPGQYLLVQEASNAAVGAPLPEPF